MKYYSYTKPFELESGETIDDLKIAFETFGTLNKQRSNIIWVFHAISGHTNVMEWWPGLFGEEKVYDPSSYFIICANCIGSPFGSSRPQDLDFAHFTVRDTVKAFQYLAIDLNIQHIHSIIGGSFGGYQALEFAYSFIGKIDHMILLASSAGLKAARALALLTYRTSEVFIENQTDDTEELNGLKAATYISYQADKFSNNFDAVSLYYLTKCIDTHNIGRNRKGVVKALQRVDIPALIIGFTSDLLVPIDAQRFLQKHLPEATLHEIDSIFGHDGFLKEDVEISKCIKQFYQKNEWEKNEIPCNHQTGCQDQCVILNVFAVGKGGVGTAFINQVLQTSKELIHDRRLEIRIVGVCDTQHYILERNGIKSNWKNNLANGVSYESFGHILVELKKLQLRNVVVVDNTSSESFCNVYKKLFTEKYDIVASNKHFNTSSLADYTAFRNRMRNEGRQFYYEANVGAGLPVLGLLNSLYNSSDTVTRITGVFSGSISYILNNFSESNASFSRHLFDAVDLGYTETDPRIDLGGLDVARKLVILAREINYEAEMEKVEVQSLIPSELRGITAYSGFKKRSSLLDDYYSALRGQLKEDEVLRYIADLDVKRNSLSVGLKVIKKSSSLGQIKNTDTYFEIYTESYKKQPIIIQGAGAGPEITAQAVYADLLKIGNSFKVGGNKNGLDYS